MGWLLCILYLFRIYTRAHVIDKIEKVQMEYDV